MALVGLGLLATHTHAAPLHDGESLQRVVREDYDADDDNYDDGAVIGGVVGGENGDDTDVDQLPEYAPKSEEERHVIVSIRKLRI